ncbi:MAG: methyltransferase domain-containing protein [Oscillospiraceae bacterium]|nr:methyltransferase domain-containing protein [Oscillospiraceae bacterium]
MSPGAEAQGGYGVFAQYYDALTQNVQYAARAEQLDRLIRKHQRPDSADRILLDLACGTGSLSEAFARLDYDVIGIDSSEDMLNEALDKKYDSGLPVQYLRQDMRRLDLFGTVSVTVCALDSLNHLPKAGDIRRVFERVNLFSDHGGLFLFDVNTAYKHRSVLGEQCFVYELPEAVCVWQNHTDLSNPELPVTIQLDFFSQIEGRRYVRDTECFTERYYADDLLQRLLSETGFTLLEQLDGDTFAQPRPETQRLLYVTRAAGGQTI